MKLNTPRARPLTNPPEDGLFLRLPDLAEALGISAYTLRTAAVFANIHSVDFTTPPGGKVHWYDADSVCAWLARIWGLSEVAPEVRLSIYNHSRTFEAIKKQPEQEGVAA